MLENQENEQQLQQEENAAEVKDEDKAQKEEAENKEAKQEEKKEADSYEQTIEKLQQEIAQNNDKYLRLIAEYDNFRKRCAKERLEITDAAKGDTLGEILPVFDNFERALEAQTQDSAYKAGVEMIFKQFGDALKKLGVETIDPLGETFDPNVANAVNQIEDENLGENVVAQVFQKGYKIGSKVIRYAMVSVANP